jgi:hypothetical protein
VGIRRVGGDICFSGFVRRHTGQMTLLSCELLLQKCNKKSEPVQAIYQLALLTEQLAI